MRIAVFGAGAIGGMVTALLCDAGLDPVLIARGSTLENLRAHGLTFTEKSKSQTFTPKLGDASAPDGLSPQDIVILATKAHHIEGALPALAALCGPETEIITAINGIPWWFFQRFGGADDDAILRAVDPNGALSNAFNPDNLIGCAVFLAAEVQPPFTVHSAGPRRLVLGSVARKDRSPALAEMSACLEKVGLACPWSVDIRTDVMNKLMGNLWANPLSIVTGLAMDDLMAQPVIYELGLNMMRELVALCESLGITLPIAPEERMKGTAGLGNFRTSMLQDMDRGRQIELDAILSAPLEMAVRMGTPHESMRLVQGLACARGIASGCYTPRKSQLEQTG